MYNKKLSPGPSRYRIENHRAISEVLKKPRTTSTFGCSKKDYIYDTFAPGPGAYSMSEAAVKKFRVSFTKVLHKSVKKNGRPAALTAWPHYLPASASHLIQAKLLISIFVWD